MQPTSIPTAPLRQLPGFIAGLAIILVAGVGLHLLGRSVAGDGRTSRYAVLAVTFLLSFGAFVYLQQGFWLSRLMGLRHGKSPILEAAFYTLFSIVWAFVRAAGAEPEEETGEAAGDKQKQQAHPRDPARESVETIVFVVVLVLLLKLFVTEAFVIPTGSMATTLYGYQTIVTCKECGHEFPVNSHDEVEPGQDGEMRWLVGYCCPNCRYVGEIDPRAKDSPRPRTGDRVLVLKPLYHMTNPTRGDVVVFKYPKEPQVRHTAQNYIKRAMGFGKETVGIHRGELYVTQALDYPPSATDAAGNVLYPRPDDPVDLWRPQYMYENNAEARERFKLSREAGFPAGIGGFEIVRKTDDQILACRRVVWDNDKQPAALANRNIPARWYAPVENTWTGDHPAQPRAFKHQGGNEDWIRYRHLVWAPKPDAVSRNYLRDPETGAMVWEPWAWNTPAIPVPGPIDNFLGYNMGLEVPKANPRQQPRPPHAGGEDNWVGDLILECEAELGDGGELTLELSRGVNRFQARFADGTVTLSRTGPGQGVIASRPCRVKSGGSYTIRFANVDGRLRVWVDDRAIDFGADADYQSLEPEVAKYPEGWTIENDVNAPAGVAAKGQVTVRHLRLDRDIYYTRKGIGDHAGADLYYVQPGHYMCLGDNSAQSSDSRTWGLVPERLMLGKAVFVFWPAFPDNRVGFIK